VRKEEQVERPRPQIPRGGAESRTTNKIRPEGEREVPHAQAGSGKQTGAFWQEVGFLGSRAPCHHMVALQEGQVESALGRTNKIRLARRSRPGTHLSPSGACSIPALVAPLLLKCGEQVGRRAVAGIGFRQCPDHSVPSAGGSLPILLSMGEDGSPVPRPHGGIENVKVAIEKCYRDICSLSLSKSPPGRSVGVLRFWFQSLLRNQSRGCSDPELGPESW
jgi:hypothetical protein